MSLDLHFVGLELEEFFQYRGSQIPHESAPVKKTFEIQVTVFRPSQVELATEPVGRNNGHVRYFGNT